MRQLTPILLVLAIAATPGCGARSSTGGGAEPGDPSGVAATELATGGPCDGIEARAATVWNAQIRGEVDFSVKIYAGEITAADAEWLATRMDRFTLAWIRLSRTSCAAHFEEGALDAEEYAARARCFDAALEQQREVVATLETSGRDAGNDMDGLFAELARCVPGEESPELDIRGNPFKKR